MKKTTIECEEAVGKTIKSFSVWAYGEDQGADIEFTDGTFVEIDIKPAVQLRVDISHNDKTGTRVKDKRYPKLLAVVS